MCNVKVVCYNITILYFTSAVFFREEMQQAGTCGGKWWWYRDVCDEFSVIIPPKCNIIFYKYIMWHKLSICIMWIMTGETCNHYIILQLCILYVNSKRVRMGRTSVAKSFREFHATINYMLLTYKILYILIIPITYWL